MNRQIYRKAALDKLASPDRLDRGPRIATASLTTAWLLLVGLIIAAVVWAIVAEAPITVRGRGILLAEGGLSEIVSGNGGRILSLDLQPGTLVQEGDVVARINQSELSRELDDARAELLDARERLAHERRHAEEAASEERRAFAGRSAAIEAVRAALEARLALQERREQAVSALVEREIATSARLLDASISAANTRERLLDLRNELSQLDLQRVERGQARQIGLIEQEARVDAITRRVARLERALTDRAVIRASVAGEVVEVTVAVGDRIEAGTAIARLTPTGDDAPAAIYAVMFVPPDRGKSVTVGMTVEVTPTTVRRSEFGAIMGEVESISAAPATRGGMREVLRNDALVSELSGNGAPFQAQIRLERDAANASGFRWSASDGPDTPITAGEIFDGEVTVRKVRVVGLLAPALQRLID